MTWANKLAFVLVCVIVVFTTLAYGAVHQPIIALFYVSVALLVVLWVIDGAKSGELRLSKNPLQLALLAAGVYGLIQVIPLGTVADIAGVSDIPRTISLDAWKTQVSAVHFIVLAVFFAISLTVLDSASRLRKMATVIIIFGAVYAFFAILQSVLSPNKIYGIYERVYTVPFGSFVSRHNFAAYMEMTAAIPLGLLFTGAVPRDKRLLYGTAIALMGSALLLSGSRGGFVSFVAEIVFLVFISFRTKGGKALAAKFGLAALLLFAVVAGAIFVGGESSLTRISETQKGSEAEAPIGRSHIWSVSLKAIAQNFPFGAGLGAFGVAFTPFDDRSGLERVEQAHNDYLQTAADAGLVGLIIGIFFLAILYRIGRRSTALENDVRRGIAVGALTGIFGVFVHSIFDFVLHTTAISILFLVLLALLSNAMFDYADDSENPVNRLRRRVRRTNIAPISTRRTAAAD